MTRLVGGGLDAILARLVPLFGASPRSSTREALVAALNGVLGDYLAETGNPLAIELRFRRERRAVADGARRARQRQCPRVRTSSSCWCMGCASMTSSGTGRVTTTARRSRATSATPRSTCTTTPASTFRPTARSSPMRSRSSYGDGPCRFVNSRSSRTAWAVSWRAAHATMAPPPAMRGSGICARSCFSGHRIMARRWNAAATGSTCCSGSAPTPHRSRGFGKIRSAGITDLRYGNLTHEDWQGRDRFARGDRRRFVPLPEGVGCYAIAATTAKHPRPIGTEFAGRWPRSGRERTGRARSRHAFPAYSEIPAMGCPWLRASRSAGRAGGLPAHPALAGHAVEARRRGTADADATARRRGQMTREYCAFCCASRRYRSKCIATVRTRSRPRIVTSRPRSVSTTSPSAASGASDARSGAK